MAEEASQGKVPFFHEAVEELKELWAMALPVAAMNCLVFLRAAVSIFFLGRLGRLELAGGALAVGFVNITGYSVLVGLAAGLEPVCSQAYGSKNWELLVVSLQRMVLILLLATIPISLLWMNLKPIMIFMGQEAEITETAAAYCLYSLPDLLTNTVLQPMRVYLRSQRVTKPMMYCTLAAVALHAPLNAFFVGVLRMGVQGVAMASVVTNVNMAVLMVGYVYIREGLRWTGGWRAWDEIYEMKLVPLLRLAIPSCLGICLEWWWYEIVTVLAGYLPNPTVSLAATGVLIQTTSLMYTVPMALAGCVSARVGNELGAGRPRRARIGAVVALGCAAVVGALHVAWTSTYGEKWAGLFTEDAAVKALVATVMPLMGLCELGNCPQTTGCGILRGTARPAVGARINLGSFYIIGTPVAVGLAFVAKVGFSGLWFGLLAAQAACAASILYVVLVRTDWDTETLRARKLAGVEMIAPIEEGGEVEAFLGDENGPVIVM